MYRVNVKLDGRTESGGSDILMHPNDVQWRDEMEKWAKDPANKGASRAGDDRTPAWRWVGNVYHDGKVVGIPSDNLMTAIRGGATMVGVPGGGKKTYKQASQSGLLVNEILWPIKVEGKTIPWAPIKEMVGVQEFEKHMAFVRELGFELFVKPANVNGRSHIRVRPRIFNWTAEGTITVLNDTFALELVRTFLENAGLYCGVGDWRPSAPKSPGPFGRFAVSVEMAKR